MGYSDGDGGPVDDEPLARPVPLKERLLRYYVEQAIDGQPTARGRLGAARVMNTRRWRLVSVFDLDDDGRPDPHSLCYRVELLASDGWATLCTIHWQLLGLEMADVYFELNSTLRQHQGGTYPGGPNDPHARERLN
jgi:hypothetical protein